MITLRKKAHHNQSRSWLVSSLITKSGIVQGIDSKIYGTIKAYTYMIDVCKRYKRTEINRINRKIRKLLDGWTHLFSSSLFWGVLCRTLSGVSGDLRTLLLFFHHMAPEISGFNQLTDYLFIYLGWFSAFISHKDRFFCCCRLPLCSICLSFIKAEYYIYVALLYDAISMKLYTDRMHLPFWLFLLRLSRCFPLWCLEWPSVLRI